MASAAAESSKRAAAEDLATAPTADTSPAVPDASNSSSSSNSSRSSSSRSSSSHNYGVALGAVGAAVSVTLLQYLPRLLSAEGRQALRAALAGAGSSDWFLLFCCSIFFCGCIGSILYNAHLAHNCRLERFVAALVRQQRRQQQQLLLQQQPLPEQQQQLQDRNAQQREQLEQQQQQQHPHGEDSECCCCDEEEDRIGVLFVTAHPDDESMFFAPSISLFASSKERFEVFVLCLSTGDYEGLGSVRSAELAAAAAAFCVPKENFVCLDEKEMKDGWTKWDSKAVCAAVKSFVEKRKQIQVIFSFDELGVSRHPNHCSVYEGLRLYNAEILETCKEQQKQHQQQRKQEHKQQQQQQLQLRKDEAQADSEAGTQRKSRQQEAEDEQQQREQQQMQDMQLLPSVFIFSLQSYGLLRKYSGVLNLIPATIDANNKGVDVAACVTPRASVRGMLCHSSQLVWFRWLFVLFSSSDTCKGGQLKQPYQGHAIASFSPAAAALAAASSVTAVAPFLSIFHLTVTRSLPGTKGCLYGDTAQLLVLENQQQQQQRQQLVQLQPAL
ncbi:N-acetylglucosaminylphosphatidylinositol deacetylase, putative [Eimeria tenella]|uniref:N-acetylglucosaminylphosphatidylinositol deacetylase n=1 Tax=Eimeria tenella TaxID=5802 RepID=U6KUI6_EIMTE|nr:N-acetylglucosaminylphosphatidylinositol deacetylase, putative [Eimeria tenella]CDJ41621.1 N-acetylglucosaminylphosphatidylinositol deacetylase, putative [Eimeria tenella]|eukprot:XP_013232371.1 N-acetylglucosaminylphosphatidylinositol deacetylase, putative [Eimeria tenella]